VLDQHRPIILLELLEPALQQQGKCSQYLLDLLNVHGYDIYYFDKETGHPLINQGQLATENIIAAPHEWVMPI
ncbi:MAG: hypothetical protein IMZ64_07850, partial [Bacteroidetes bacterium]|nr:hypothetical protein [Bacteroidota bacterium]